MDSKPFEVGEQVYHKTGGAPMIIINVEKSKIETRWVVEGIVHEFKFEDFELVHKEDFPKALNFERLQEVTNEAQLLQAEAALENLRSQRTGISKVNQGMSRQVRRELMRKGELPKA